MPVTEADALYQGSRYNVSSSVEGSNETCAYPVEATPGGTCPTLEREESQAGFTSFDLGDPEAQPPDVAATIALLQFDNIDQVLLTFTIRINMFLAWSDSRSYAQIQNATAAAARTGKCQKYCSKSTLAGGSGDCCDGIWLPTLDFIGAQTRNFVEEDFTITAQGPDYPVIDGFDNRNTTFYWIMLTVTAKQAFDFSAFPFDKHALLLKIMCQDCRFIQDPSGGASAFFATYRFSSENKTAGTQVEAQDIPASSGWQLNAVDLAMVNISTDFSIDRPSIRGTADALAKNASADYYGMVFVLQVERVTRLYYALQTIMPQIILVLVGFSCFTVAQDKFIDRIRLLISVLFPTVVIQFTISNSLPKTYTLLTPQLLAFVSLLELAVLILISCGTYHILNRKNHLTWKLGIKKTQGKYAKQREWLLEGFQESESGEEKEGEDEKGSGDEEDPQLTKKQSAISNGGFLTTEHKMCGEIASEKESEEAESKAAHDEAVRQVAWRTQRGPKCLREVRLWFTSLALSDSGGQRDRVAFIWETWALSFAFIAYVAVVLGIFLRANANGQRNDQL